MAAPTEVQPMTKAKKAKFKIRRKNPHINYWGIPDEYMNDPELLKLTDEERDIVDNYFEAFVEDRMLKIKNPQNTLFPCANTGYRTLTYIAPTGVVLDPKSESMRLWVESGAAILYLRELATANHDRMTYRHTSIVRIIKSLILKCILYNEKKECPARIPENERWTEDGVLAMYNSRIEQVPYDAIKDAFKKT